MKKLLLMMGLVCLGVFVACAGPAGATGSPGSSAEAEPEADANPEEAQEERPQIVLEDAPDFDLMQFRPPESGDTIAILHTNMGDVTLRFFPEEAPKAYENFVTHARDGYYDGVIFHRVIENFMIQGGDPEGTGMGGESIWGEGFGPEFSMYLRHFRGALAMAQSAMPNSIGSQFYIVHNHELAPDARMMLEALLEQHDELVGELDGAEVFTRDFFTSDMMEAYFSYGGVPHLDIPMGIWTGNVGHTVFGQVIAGMDVVDAIATVETVPGQDRPAEDVIIESITVTEF